MTGDAKLKLIKSVRETVEKGKVNIRNTRKDARNELVNLKKRLSADLYRRHEKDIDSKTDSFVKKMDELFQSKESELK
jgi:ribosome recycling factor